MFLIGSEIAGIINLQVVESKGHKTKRGELFLEAKRDNLPYALFSKIFYITPGVGRLLK